ncbi:MAG TPA: HEAT repeat domain-containing protein [Polyangiales bacterium]
MRRALTLLCLLIVCTGFEWPGRLPRLQFELAHGNPASRTEAARRMGNYPIDDVREALLQALEDDEPGVRLQAAAALGQARAEQAVPTLLPWLADKSEQVRLTATRALGQIGAARARDALVRVLGDSSAQVRAAAVVAVSALSDAETLPALLASLDDNDASVRLAAALALRGNRDGRVVSALAKRCRDDDAPVRSAALQTLASTGAPQALALLQQGLADGSPEVRIAAALGLGQLADPSSLTALHDQLTREPGLAKAALVALGHIVDPRAQAWLVDELGEPELAATAGDALVERVRRLGDSPTSEAGQPGVVQALAQVLQAPRSQAQLLAATQTLLQLAPLTSIVTASPALQHALQERAQPPHQLVQALALTRDPEALVPLLQRIEADDDAALEPTLDALFTYFDGIAPDGRAADPLLARLPKSSGSARVKLVRLLGMTRASRAAPALLPLLASPVHAEQVAALEALGRIGAPQSRAALWALLSSSDAQLSDGAAHALRELVSETEVVQLLELVRSRVGRDQQRALLVLGPALARLSATHKLSEQIRSSALQTLTVASAAPDRALAASALCALRRFGPAEGSTIVAQLLRSPALRERAAAAFALSSFDGEESRKLLRYVLQRSNSRITAAAIAALGELGDQRDVAALIRAAARSHWPVTATAAYALARMSQRGVVKQRSTQRVLCELGRSRDPYVRANVAAAMAAMAAPACDDGPSPLAWLDPRHAPAVRAAAAHWARAAAAVGSLPEQDVGRALRACAADADASVASACALPGPTPASGALQTTVAADDGRALQRNRMAALRLANGAVFLGYTDDNGELLLRSAPTARFWIEDPTATPREPL